MHKKKDFIYSIIELNKENKISYLKDALNIRKTKINLIKIHKKSNNLLKQIQDLKIIIIIHIILNVFHRISSKENFITLKINKAGEKIYVYSETSLIDCGNEPRAPTPKEVYINNVKQSIKAYHNFNQTNNIVKLVYPVYSALFTGFCMFSHCSNITEIDLSNFDTYLMTQWKNMFFNCKSLVSLSLAKLNVYNLNSEIYLNNFLVGCNSLKYLNLEGSYIDKPFFFDTIFKQLGNENLVICNTSVHFLENNLPSNLKCNIRYSCFSNNTETLGKQCFQNCSATNKTYNNYDICDRCGNNFYPMISLNYSSNDNQNIQCYYKPYESISVTENIIKTSRENMNEIFSENMIRTAENIIDNNIFNMCQYYHYIEENTNELFCTNNLSCPKNYPLLIKEHKECAKKCSKDSFKTKYYECIKINYEDYNNKTELVKFITNLCLNELDISDVNRGNDLEFCKDNLLVSLTTTYNQKNNLIENKNKTIIDLIECENKLISDKIIPNNSTLYIVKIDIEEKGMKIPKVEYEVYYTLNNSYFIKLDLSVCKNIKIDISTPVKINENIDKYNSSSDYHNNICSKTKSNKGADISLNDRHNLFVENNMTLCEEDCNLVEYNQTTERAKCSCLVKISLPLIEDIKFDKNKLLKSFTDINNIANIHFMKCYKEVFKLNNIKKNIGFYIYILLLILHLVSLFLFYFKFYSKLTNEIQLIIDSKKYMLDLNKNENKVKRKKKRKRKLNKAKKDENMFQNKRKNKNILLSTNNDNINNLNNITLNANNEIKESNIKNKQYYKYKEIMELNEIELNSLPYEKAIINDKRTFFQYYISLLKINHLLIFSFYYKKRDYNSQIIKIFLFFFFFSVHITINALFFNDGTMHEIFIDEGEFNFIYQLSQIIYSSLISAIVDILIKYLSLTEENILELKNEEDIIDFDIKHKELLNKFKIKFIMFFSITFVLLFLFMFYITCFCGIYLNTQKHLFADSIISFGLDLIYPFAKFLIPSSFRILALRAEKKDKKIMYKFSQLIQNI